MHVKLNNYEENHVAEQLDVILATNDTCERKKVEM
jgi:hypothetical protein